MSQIIFRDPRENDPLRDPGFQKMVWFTARCMYTSCPMVCQSAANTEPYDHSLVKAQDVVMMRKRKITSTFRRTLLREGHLCLFLLAYKPIEDSAK